MFMLTEVLFTMAKVWEQPRGPPKNNSAHTVKFHSALKKDKVCHYRKTDATEDHCVK